VKKRPTKKQKPAKRGDSAKARPRPPPKPARRPAPAAPARARLVPAAAHARRNGATKPTPATSAAPSLASDEPIRLLAPDGAWLGGAHDPPPAPELALELFRGMLRVRLLDGRMLNLQRQGRIGFYGQSTGQEAAIIGSAAAATAQDWIAPALREAGVAVWRGLPLARLIAQCMARDGEPSRGRQMPCHHTFRAGNFISMSSVIATQLVHATGIALAAKLKKDPVVAIGYLGDGATSEHDFHSALNFAAVWKAPVVFFCQNNQWAISVPVSRQTASRTLAVKAVAYGMPGVRVDGNDVVAVHRVTRDAVERARGGGGPTFVEALTYRRMGHSSSDDPTKYRDSAEVAKWEQLDPIDRMRGHLTARGLLTKAMEEGFEEEIQAAISAAITEAEALPEPAAESLVEDVFAEPTPQLVAQRDDLLRSLGQSGAPPSAHAHGR
jgi:pyruvate dehydrogenase E1 component alpha subunit/2-oxoisovalerate dehydrogenase E1 component alpha subunit